jgi:hypothetical protein
MARDFNPSNLAGTCLWCGRTIPNRSPERSLAMRIRKAEKLGPRFVKDVLEFHEHYKGRPGGNGTGYFCTGTCAEMFGSAAARDGYRF